MRGSRAGGIPRRVWDRRTQSSFDRRLIPDLFEPPLNSREESWAICDGDWLLIDGKDGHHSRRDAEWDKRHGIPADNEAPVELYHLGKDLGQSADVAGENPDKVT